MTKTVSNILFVCRVSSILSRFAKTVTLCPEKNIHTLFANEFSEISQDIISEHRA